jgi:hypothetical protein
MQSGLCYSQIYIADEMGLFWHGLSENTQAPHMEQSTPGRKKSFCFTDPDYHLIRMTSTPKYRVYCITLC